MAALDLASQSIRVSNPNPRVGCTIVSPEGQTIGEGHTQQAGGHHAEVMALSDAQTRGLSVVGATVNVTLEPCSHHGRTPPCCDALIRAQVGKVMVATVDPNPLVAGRGIARLREAGIEVVLLSVDDSVARASRELNIGFFSRMTRQIPWVRMKVASSLDGTTALANGTSQWITGEKARIDGHSWRARSCAVITGIGTVLEDDPMLDVRFVETPRQPHLVVVDSQLKMPLHARLFQPTSNGLKRQILVYHACADSDKQLALQEKSVVLVNSPESAAGRNKVDLQLLLQDLAHREVNEVLLEAGHGLNGSFVKEGLVDEFLVYLAPKWLGKGSGMSNFGPIDKLEDGVQLQFRSTETLGDDLRILARVAGRDAFLNG